MPKFVERTVQYCVSADFISQEDAPWFRYCLEKRISTIIVGVPFFILALIMSNFLCAISFFSTYFFIKKYLGGYHAQTMWGCLGFSLLMELLFLGFLPHFMNAIVFFLLWVLCILLILKLAPYNHPNLHLTHKEVEGCRKKVRQRLCFILVVTIIMCLAGIGEIASGCTIGIAMATALLCMGYINNWRNTHNGTECN